MTRSLDHETGKTIGHADESIVFRQLHVVNFCGRAVVGSLIIAEDSGPIAGQLPFPDSNQVGMKLAFPRMPVDLPGAFKRLQRSPELETQLCAAAVSWPLHCAFPRLVIGSNIHFGNE